MSVVPDRPSRETGAILPLVALLIVALMIFAAFAVDLGAAWAERRQLQSAADAGAMAAVLPPPEVGDTMVSVAMDYVDRNVGTPVDRFGCGGWDPASTGVPGTFVLADPDESNCVWVSRSTSEPLMHVAVKVPTQNVPTSFATVIGIDSVPVDAFAVSEVDYSGLSRFLPFALKPDPTAKECLGSPPGGISRDPCAGSTTGNFGYLTSEFHGTGGFGVGNTCPPGEPSGKVVTVLNMIHGTDHPLSIDIKWPSDAAGADADLPDDCTKDKEPPGYIPDSAMFCTECAHDTLHAGLVEHSDSRLRTTGAGTRTITGDKGDNLVLDNVGLWDYVTGGCDFGGLSGPDLTARMQSCLATGGVTFSDALWESPRFGVVPEFWDTFSLGSSTPRAIKRFRGVYINESWFNCSASPDDCLLFTDSEGEEQPVFAPGEGTEEECKELGASGKCGDSQIRGIAAFVLPAGSVPDHVINEGSVLVRLLRR
ncbi:MAG: pilus assembly protein TadG-related protein [Actinomycetota bacterium]